VIEQALAGTGAVTVDVVWHTPDDGAVAAERSPAASLTFTASGAWWLKSSAGTGQVDPGWLLALRPGEEYECRHPHGVADRSLSVTFLREMEPVSGALVRVGERGRQLRRRLYRAATARHPDPEEIDAVAVSLLAWARRPGEEASRIGAWTRARVAEVRREADRSFADAELDLVAAGKAAGLSRTRLIHAFRELVGLTPHRYLLERRVSHAARLLADGDMPVAEVCFASGFGSLARFNAAFRIAHGLPPSGYRAVCRGHARAAEGGG
jgi:AraC family transcriptional regulator